MAESGRRASASSSARSRSVMGRVKSLFAWIRLSCRDDADFLFAILFLHRVDDQQQNHASREPNRMPALLTIEHSFDVRDGAEIVENPRGNLERDAMLLLVRQVLGFIPDNLHRPTIVRWLTKSMAYHTDR